MVGARTMATSIKSVGEGVIAFNLDEYVLFFSSAPNTPLSIRVPTEQVASCSVVAGSLATMNVTKSRRRADTHVCIDVLLYFWPCGIHFIISLDIEMWRQPFHFICAVVYALILLVDFDPRIYIHIFRYICGYVHLNRGVGNEAVPPGVEGQRFCLHTYIWLNIIRNNKLIIYECLVVKSMKCLCYLRQIDHFISLAIFVATNLWVKSFRFDAWHFWEILNCNKIGHRRLMGYSNT